ncbi:ABC transporter permease [Undibacterium arcticum]|uniref:ABC transporter permease n=1 Tax=Undibacterium arcticum TaxID=1762892 RepID=UPI003623A899
MPHFVAAGNVLNIATQASILMMIAMPMTLIILSEGLDLSAGALLSLCSVCFALALGAGLGLGIALALSVFVGLSFGALNGVLISKLRLPPFVVTLGTFGIAQGTALVLTDGNVVSVGSTSISQVYAWSLLGVPFPVLAALIIYGLTHLLLYHTRFGTYVFAIGGNRDSLVLAGIRAHLYHIGVYAFCGLIVGFAALLLTGRMNSAHPTSAIGIEFDAIAAVVLGGTSFEKGDGWLFGTVLGVITISVLRNALNLFGIESSLQVVSVGVLVLVIILIDSARKSRMGKNV